MSFKDMIQRDIKDIFLNPKEFGELHIVDGEEMSIIIDDNEMVEREKRYKSLSEGLHIKQLLIYAPEEDYGPLPLVNRLLELDGDYYTVTDAISEGGIHSISLEVKQS